MYVYQVLASSVTVFESTLWRVISSYEALFNVLKVFVVTNFNVSEAIHAFSTERAMSLGYVSTTAKFEQSMFDEELVSVVL